MWLRLLLELVLFFFLMNMWKSTFLAITKLQFVSYKHLSFQNQLPNENKTKVCHCFHTIRRCILFWINVRCDFQKYHFKTKFYDLTTSFSIHISIFKQVLTTLSIIICKLSWLIHYPIQKWIIKNTKLFPFGIIWNSFCFQIKNVPFTTSKSLSLFKPGTK